MRMLFLAVLLAALLAAPQAGAAAQRTMAQAGECDAALAISWRESTTGSISLFYPEQYELIGQTLALPAQREAIDREIDRFNALFETTLGGPLTIRVYPDQQAFACLNPSAPALPTGLIHTTAGAREVALMGDRILAGFPTFMKHYLNLVRYDLGILFARQVAGLYIPPGLLEATGHYLQDPAQTTGALRLNRSDWVAPASDLRGLWEQPAAPQDLSRKLQATSTVAYLVDNYGWSAFLRFLKSLPGAQHFGPALERSYGVALGQVEEGWRAFYPRYFQGGWQSHAIYNYDLRPYQEMIRAEQYHEAGLQLQEVIGFLDKIGSAEKRSQAQALLQMARDGLEAETLLAQSQQAFYEGKYLEALVLVEQAGRKYARTSTYIYHTDEFAAYREQVRQVVALHRDLDRLEDQLGSHWNTLLLTNQLIDTGRRLSALGDVQGFARAQALASALQGRQRDQFVLVTAGVLGIILALLAVRIGMVRRTPPPEAQL